MASKIFALQAYTQSYDWGKLGSASKAAAYARVATPGFEVDEGKPYAEVGRLVLWILSPRPCGVSLVLPTDRSHSCGWARTRRCLRGS